MDTKEIQNHEIKGNFASPFSIKPLKDVKKLTYNLDSYLEDLRKKYNSSVFKIHPGLETIVCLDHVSATYYFNAPQTILEREDAHRFGPIAVHEELVGGSCPALISTGKTHDNARQLTDDILKAREKHLEPAFDKVTERLLKKWESSSEHTLFEILVEWSGNISYNWLLDTDIDMKQAKSWLFGVFTVNTDTILTQLLGKVVSPKCPHLSIQMQKEKKEFIAKSPLFDEYVKLAKKHNVSTETLTDFLVFLNAFNGTGAPAFSIYYAIVRIYKTPELKALLKKELTGASKDEILKNPLLDNVMHEVMRLNAVPRIYFKKAQCDFSMPAAGGKSYAIKKDDLILIPATVSHRDKTVFENPDVFDPYRYEKDASLKEKVFGFGITKTTKNSYGCAAASAVIGQTNQATWVWKNLFAKFITNIDFEFTEEPTFNYDGFFSFYPISIKMKNVTINSNNIIEKKKIKLMS